MHPIDIGFETLARRPWGGLAGGTKATAHADERAFRGSPEPGADVIREVASMSAPDGRTPLPTKWSE